MLAAHVREKIGARGRTFYAVLRIPGERNQKWVKLGRKWTGKGRPPEGYLTKKMAEDRCRDLVTDAGRGELPGQRQPKTGLTFCAAAREWLAYIEQDRQRRHSTVVNLGSLIDSILIPAFGDSTPVESITPDTVDAYRQKIVQQGRAPTTVNKRLITLSGIFKLAMKRHGLKANPCEGVERQRHIISGKAPNYEWAEVMALASKAPVPYRFLYVVAAFTGLRMGELRPLRWEHIDFKRRVIRVHGSYVHGSE